MTTADKQAPVRGINVKKRTDNVTVRGRLMRLISDLLRQTPFWRALLFRFGFFPAGSEARRVIYCRAFLHTRVDTVN